MNRMRVVAGIWIVLVTSLAACDDEIVDPGFPAKDASAEVGKDGASDAPTLEAASDATAETSGDATAETSGDAAVHEDAALDVVLAIDAVSEPVPDVVSELALDAPTEATSDGTADVVAPDHDATSDGSSQDSAWPDAADAEAGSD